MNEAFQKYDFPQSNPKKILIPRVSQKDKQPKVGFQLNLDFMEQESKDNMKEKRV